MSLSEKFIIIIPPQDISVNPDCLQRLVAGDAQAFQWLYKNYSRKVYDYAFLMTHNVHQSEDIVQEVFLKIWMHRAKLKNVDNFNGYVHTIVKNHTVDQMRSQAKEQYNLREFVSYASGTIAVHPENLEYKQGQQILKDAIRSLPPRQQLAYTLRREHGWKRDRIAQELNVSPSTVKAHIQKAIRFIKGYVGGRMG